MRERFWQGSTVAFTLKRRGRARVSSARSQVFLSVNLPKKLLPKQRKNKIRRNHQTSHVAFSSRCESAQPAEARRLTRRKIMNVGGKRSVAMMLGTDWTSGPPVASKPLCNRCNRHNGRRPKTSVEKAALAKTRPDLLGRCCNGTRVAGDAWVQCDSFGWITLCCG
eukprot:6518806-Prymnesium_polylepis.1